jgi:RNA polymerase sigma-70 factor, ECF subfamily
MAATDFATLADPYRPELLAYCYRMLGSVDEAEDQVQETLLRAWRAFDDFEGRSSLRTWLYRIATNTCLRALETRSRRPLPSGLGAPAEDPDGALGALAPELPWLQPFPDALVTAGAADPAAVVSGRASMRLALVAALQYLPPRQRAVLILRDVLGWHAAEVAELLGVSTAAANSVLQRARAQLAQASPAEDDLREPDDPADRELLDRYATAFQTADIAALTALLREDATMEMPPQPYWFAGREQVSRFLASRVLTAPGLFALVPTSANGQRAFGAYMRSGDGSYAGHGVQLVSVSGRHVTRIVSFNDDRLLAVFGLPHDLPAAPGPVVTRP